jgi:hypothetical protein
MFLGKKFILGSELTHKMGIHFANVSILRKELEDRDNTQDIKRLNNCTFISRNGFDYPRNIREGLDKFDLVDCSDKLPKTYIKSEFNLNVQDLKIAGIYKDEIDIYGKKLVQFTPEFVKQVEGCVVYILCEAEAHECLADKSIDGMIKISKKKYITWYNVY